MSCSAAFTTNGWVFIRIKWHIAIKRYKQMLSCYYCAHAHSPHTQRSPVPINHVDANEWKRGWENTGASRSVFTNLLSRQQIHSADWDELGDICTATIFPGRVWCYWTRLPGCRWSLMSVSLCRAPSPPAPLLPAASHNYRLPLPSLWHEDDLCQSVLMGFPGAPGGLTNDNITCTAVHALEK